MERKPGIPRGPKWPKEWWDYVVVMEGVGGWSLGWREGWFCLRKCQQDKEVRGWGMMRVIAIMRPRTVQPMLKAIVFVMVCVIVERITNNWKFDKSERWKNALQCVTVPSSRSIVPIDNRISEANRNRRMQESGRLLYGGIPCMEVVNGLTSTIQIR